MVYPTVADFVQNRPRFPGGTIAILLCESARYARQSAQRLRDQGARAIIAVGAEAALDLGTGDLPVFRIAEAPRTTTARELLNPLFDLLDGRWVLWLWNGEFFVFPFDETRCLSELTTFLKDERRKLLYTYALDLYAWQLPPDDSDLAQVELHFDRIGYHAFPKPNQQLRLFGGLGWRFEDLTPPGMQQIGRTALLKAEKGVHLNREMLFGESDFDSVSCPWHNNPTGAVMTLRRAARIMAHPAFPDSAHHLFWAGSERFNWSSDQLLQLGMIEPGQWF